MYVCTDAADDDDEDNDVDDEDMLFVNAHIGLWPDDLHNGSNSEQYN